MLIMARDGHLHIRMLPQQGGQYVATAPAGADNQKT
jgi:hypothetical protein